MNIEVIKMVDFERCCRFGVALAAISFAALSGCAEASEQANAEHAPSIARNALSLDTDESDSGTAGALCGDRKLDATEECDPSVEGWKYLCDEHCKRLAYKPCDNSVDDCGGNNALCASYAAEPGTQFCADFCRNDATCPVVPGFHSACNLAWCAVLCNDGQCPNGMSCFSEATFLDFEGNSRDPQDVCVVTSSVQREPRPGF